MWECVCDCGKTATVRGTYLNNGSTKSCGCKKYNSFSRIKDLRGKKFGRITVLEFAGIKKGYGAQWKCICDCGNEVVTAGKGLLRGTTKSCGCLKHERLLTNGFTHHGAYSRLYTVWAGMKQRCSNPNHKSYKDYGGRGISVCAAWDDFQAFEDWAIKNGYNPDAPYGDCTIDRINVNGNYEPSNCRWVDSITQARNKRLTNPA